MKRELYRKLIHLATVAVPLLVWLAAARRGASWLLGAAVAAALLVEWARARVRWARYHFLRRTRTMLRPHERRGLAGATYMVVGLPPGASSCFPKPVAVAAMLYNGLGDAAAALVGKRWGRHRTAWGKSWEGAGRRPRGLPRRRARRPGGPAAGGARAARSPPRSWSSSPSRSTTTCGSRSAGGAAAWAGAVLAESRGAPCP